MDGMNPASFSPAFSNQPMNAESRATPLNTQYDCGKGCEGWACENKSIGPAASYSFFDNVGGLYVPKVADSAMSSPMHAYIIDDMYIRRFIYGMNGLRTQEETILLRVIMDSFASPRRNVGNIMA